MTTFDKAWFICFMKAFTNIETMLTVHRHCHQNLQKKKNLLKVILMFHCVRLYTFTLCKRSLLKLTSVYQTEKALRPIMKLIIISFVSCVFLFWLNLLRPSVDLPDDVEHTTARNRTILLNSYQEQNIYKQNYTKYKQNYVGTI